MGKIYIKQLYNTYIPKLKFISTNPLRDLEKLLLSVCYKKKDLLVKNLNTPLNINNYKIIKLYKYLNRRLLGEPIEYILEQCVFYSMSLKIKPTMFIPRHVTELLVTQILYLLKNQINTQSILELGTGTGAISLAINKIFNNKHIILALDNNKIAINCAINNLNLLNIKNITFCLYDWYQNIVLPIKFNFIITNPPYVDKNDLFYYYLGNHFESNKTTLANANGLQDLFHIIYIANKFYLNKGGWLILEHSWYQTHFIKKYLLWNNFTYIFTKKDYNLNNIITGGKKQ